jgi:hypothetical protein
MRGGFVFSISIHALILLLVLFGLPFFKAKPREQPPMISVELIQSGKETKTNKVSPAEKITPKPEEDAPPPPPKPQPSPEPQPQPTPQPPEPPKPPEPALQPVDAPPLEAVDEAAPAVETPQADIKPQMAPVPKLAELDESAPKLAAPPANLKPHLAPPPELAAVDEKLAALVPPAKVELKRPQPKVPAKSFDSVLKNLTRTEPAETSPDTPPQPETKVAKHPSGAHAPLSMQLTQSELGALQQQLGRCWDLPASAKDAQNLVVYLDVVVNPDRTVASAEIVDQGRMSSDPTYAAAARAAKRAVLSPACTPLDLPPEKYQEWQEMNIRFDPKEMLGQ